MIYFFDPMYGAVHILTESEKPTRKEELQIQAVLEDGESPVTNKYLEKLYDSVISKDHIDFGNIPNSKGNIVEYSGYTNIIEVLENIMKLAVDGKSQNVIDYVKIVKESISHMRALAPIYQKGFRLRNEYVMLEYNTFVYTIIQATSTILYEFVDYIKRPDRPTIDIVLKNTKYRANTFYIDQLNKFNNVNNKMQYSKFLDAMIQNGKENFTGVEVVGLGTIIAVALAIVPITRELVYRFYTTKSNLSDCLAQQAYFLEMNRTVVEANSDFTQKKKDAILLKQEKIKNLCLKLSDKLRVTHIKEVDSGRAQLQNDNKLLTLDGIKKEISNSPLQLL
jgi:hypothetical protein